MSIDNASDLEEPQGPADSPVAEPAKTSPPAPHGRRGRIADAAALTTFLLLGVYLTSGLLRDPFGLHVTGNRQDSVQLQWLLLHATRLFTHGENPFFTTLVNAPYGVNLMANTSILAFAFPLTPITLAFGPAVSAAVLLTLAPASTSAAWYHVLSRHIVDSRPAAFLGALFAGFAPAMVSHDTGHPNIVAQFALPYVVLAVLRIRIPGRAVRTGVELGCLVVLQVFINEEMLFLTAVTLALVILAVLALRPREVIPHLRSGLLVVCVALCVAGTVLAYPLWYQFFGPMAYRGLPTFVLDYGADLSSFRAFSTESLIGPSAGIWKLGPNVTEQNTYYGWPLLIVLVLVAIRLWRAIAARALVFAAVVIGMFSLGRVITIGGHRTSLRGPWGFVSHLPLFDSVVPTRLAIFITPLLAVLLAMSIDMDRRTWLSRHAPGEPEASRRWAGRWSRISPLVWAGVVIVVLIPIAPTPIGVSANVPTPRFFTSGVWRQYFPVGANLLPVPPAWNQSVDVMQWQVAVDDAFVTSTGYYLAPPPSGKDRRANFGPEYLPTTDLLMRVASTGILDEQVSAAQALADLRTWRVDGLILPETATNADALRDVLDRLVGPGRHVQDVWFWDVRAFKRFQE